MMMFMGLETRLLRRVTGILSVGLGKGNDGIASEKHWPVIHRNALLSRPISSLPPDRSGFNRSRMKTKNLIVRFLPLAIATALVSQIQAQSPAGGDMQRAEVSYRRGLAAEKAGDPDAARQAYLAALAANPRHANARYCLGQLKINSAAISAKGREEKFGAVMIAEFNLDEASLQESLDALRILVEKQSKEEVTPNFVLQDSNKALAEARISLRLKNTPARGVLQYLLEQANAKARFDEHAIVILPK